MDRLPLTAHTQKGATAGAGIEKAVMLLQISRVFRSPVFCQIVRRGDQKEWNGTQTQPAKRRRRMGSNSDGNIKTIGNKVKLLVGIGDRKFDIRKAHQKIGQEWRHMAEPERDRGCDPEQTMGVMYGAA